MSNAVGGVKLQVRESDVHRAIELLKGANYNSKETSEKDIFLIDFTQKITSRIPIINKLSTIARFIFFIFIISSLIGVIIYYSTKKSTKHLLCEYDWCVEPIRHANIILEPNTIELLKINSLNCNEYATFRENGTVILPGINSSSIRGDWQLNGNILTITNIDTLREIYQQEFHMTIEDGHLSLSSNKTFINARAFNIF